MNKQITKKISRKTVFKALAVETLQGGTWFTNSTPNCTVCAVGAVLRHCSFETWANNEKIGLYRLGCRAVKIDNTKYDINITANDYDVKGLLKKKNYLGALSAYFEMGHDKYECMEFVAKHFPKEFKLTVRFKN